MMFAAPKLLWFLVLAPLAVLLGAAFWNRLRRRLTAWAQPGLWHRLGIAYSRVRVWRSLVALGLALAAIALALARPRWGTVETEVERQGVDIVFLLDSSLSMATEDVVPSRLAIARSLIRRLASSLPGHRVALVQAEGKGLVLAPLTTDAAVLDLLLDTVLPASLPEPGTQLGDALRQAVDLYPPDGEKHRVLVVVSDGEDHGSAWQASLQKLKDASVVVHTLGVGTQRGGPIPLPTADDRSAPAQRYKLDSDGRVVVSKLGESTLERMAAETGGIYLAVTSPATDPGPVVQAIDAMDKRSFEARAVDVLAERFQWPLGLAALCLALHLMASPLVTAARPDAAHAGGRDR